MKKTKRTDPQYLEIERFKKYELTNNICFEMAIRNQTIQDMVLIINDHYDKTHLSIKINEFYSCFINFFPRDDNFEYFSGINLLIPEIKEILKNILHEVFYLNEIVGNENWLNFYNFMPQYNNKHKTFNKTSPIKNFRVVDQIKNNFQEGLYDEEYEINCEDPDIEKQRYEYFNDFWSSHVQIGEQLNWQIKNFKEFILTSNLINREDLPEIDKDLFDIKANCYYISEHIINQNFSRPLLKTSSSNKFVTLENINLNLPDEELFDYIRILKKEFAKDKQKNEKHQKSSFITWHEIYKRETYETKETIDIKNKAREKKTTQKKFTDTFDNNTKIADMFFIYDAKKQNMSQRDIITELSYFHGIQKDGTLINKYHEFAVQLIDCCHYKKYLSGIYLVKTSI